MTNGQDEIDRGMANKASKMISEVVPILQKAAMGDFSENIAIPEKEDEFTELLVALNLMIDDLKESTESLEKKVEKRTEELDAANQQLKAANQQLRASEQQLKASGQQLKASGQQLEVSNQQLNAANQQLRAANQQLEASEKQLQEKISELEKFNKLAVGRELKMVELKKEIAKLKQKLGANRDNG